MIIKNKVYLYYITISLFSFLSFVGCNSEEERRLRNWISRIEKAGAIRRIIIERYSYTRHFRQVVCGKWNNLQVGRVQKSVIIQLK